MVIVVADQTYARVCKPQAAVHPEASVTGSRRPTPGRLGLLQAKTS
jgi:hypothetical protein